MDASFQLGRFSVKITGRGLENDPWVISGVNDPSAAAVVEQMVIKQMMDATGLDWHIAGTVLLGIENKKIAQLTVGVKDMDKTRDFFFDVTEAFEEQ